LWSTRDTLDLRTDIRHYLARATRNRALDCVAREMLHRKWAESSHDADDLPHGRVLAHDNEHDLDNVAIVEESRRALHDAVTRALAAMPARRRQVCELRWQQDLRPTQIAAQLSISVKTVETQIARGLGDLRSCLKAHAGGGAAHGWSS
jgi:RNA polymerase sigma factor (sigma-70 family)